GPRFRITLGPGCLTVGHKDLARAERTAERAQHRARMEADEVGSYWAEYVGDRAETPPRAPIHGWSRRSRARLFHATGEIDYTPMVVLGQAPVMTTLTYADDWLSVAPTGKAAKKHLEAFYMRFERAWGVPFTGLWKEEFQRRGAVHFHLWHPRPDGSAGAMRRLTSVRYRPAVGDGMTYDAWVLEVWADIVAHPDPEDRAKHAKHGAQVSEVEEGHVNTPARLAAYFAKHGAFMAKDYQNKIPPEWRKAGAGPGRFWGYKGLARTVRTVDVAPVDSDRAARILRRMASRERHWDASLNGGKGGYFWRKAVREVRVERGVRLVDPESGECRPKFRKATRPVSRFASGSGFLCLDDAPTTLVNIARALEIWRTRTPESELQLRTDDRRRAARKRVIDAHGGQPTAAAWRRALSLSGTPGPDVVEAPKR
ncbi:rolling circle replication-associated protein, partial [Streptomyces sp. H39-C1]|uniref:rolling circle replication-associated protein n=1 Tax=Streptomyces sp. H39-C1 TaxID=3004355 RepID=UPI0022AEA02A